ncbi:MAG: alpha/beta fold hydrolase [Dehalococcoidia bacterium]
MGRELTQDPNSHGLTEEQIVHVPGLASRWVRLANGAKAHYTTSGETGPAVILLHGGINGSSGTAGWRFMAPFLGANGFRVYCPDQPGFGHADTRREYWPDNGIKSYVQFVNDFADALCLDKFFIGGNSMGCSHSAYYAVNHPERVLGIGYIAGLGMMTPASQRVDGPNSKFSPNPAYKRPPFDYSDPEGSQRELMAGIIYEAKAIWPELVTMRATAATRQHDSYESRGESSARLAKDPNYQQWADITQRLPKLTIPAIYLYGLQDVLSPVENGFVQEDALPNVQVFYPNECGHQGQTDQPDMFNQAFLEFFRDGKVSWKTAEWAGVSRRRAINPNLVEAPEGGLPAADPNWVKQFERAGASA